MEVLVVVAVTIVILLVIGVAMSARVVEQYEQGVLFRLGKVVGARIVTMPIQSQGIITRDNENVGAAIDQFAQTTLRKVVGQHSLDQTLSETDKINLDIRKILDVSTVEWGVEVTLVELKDIQLPDSMKRAMARQAEAEREKRAKIINAEGESLTAAALGAASDIMMAHPLALQLRNLSCSRPPHDHHRRARLLPRGRESRRRAPRHRRAHPALADRCPDSTAERGQQHDNANIWPRCAREGPVQAPRSRRRTAPGTCGSPTGCTGRGPQACCGWWPGCGWPDRRQARAARPTGDSPASCTASSSRTRPGSPRW
jgi:hypothetical protein